VLILIFCGDNDVLFMTIWNSLSIRGYVSGEVLQLRSVYSFKCVRYATDRSSFDFDYLPVLLSLT